MALTEAQEPQSARSEVQNQVPLLNAPTRAASEHREPPKIVIRQFCDEDLPAVLAMFVDGFVSHSADDGGYVEGYIKRSLESDLTDVAGTYINPGGNFWVAIMETTESKEPQVVGMVALEKKVNNDGELRRMSVKREFRRYGVGKLLVVELEQWAKANGFKSISLWTRREMAVAHSFYKSVAYEKKSEMPIPEDPKFIIFEFVKQL